MDTQIKNMVVNRMERAIRKGAENLIREAMMEAIKDVQTNLRVKFIPSHKDPGAFTIEFNWKNNSDDEEI